MNMKKEKKYNKKDEVNKFNRKIDKKKVIRNLITVLEKIALITVFIIIISTFVFGFYRVKDNSMSPTISEGSLSIFYRMEGKYQIKDVVIYKINNKKYVSRIIATEGQVVDIDKNGNVFVDGHEETYRPIYNTIIPDGSKIKFPYTVKPGSYFVLQDYRDESQDSRIFGAIEKNKILGKVISILKVRNI